MNFKLTAACGILSIQSFATQPLRAADVQPTAAPVLLELFTSEGCSSCPPADALLMKLDKLQPVPGARIIVLSEHVDYWNSLGWRDPFSSAALSQRQAMYARQLGSEVYTPQVVIDGREQFTGSDEKSIREAITRAAAKPKVAVRIANAVREGNTAVVSLQVAPGTAARGTIWLAVADDSDESSVNRGENAGRSLAHVSVLRSLTKAGSLSRNDGFEKTIKAPITIKAANNVTPIRPAPIRIVVFVERDGAIDGADSVLLAGSV